MASTALAQSVLAAVTLVLSGTATTHSAEANDILNGAGLYVGACAFTLTVDYQPPTGALPSSSLVRFDGPGVPCVVNGAAVTGHFSAVLGPVLGIVGMGCATGVASGTGTFDTTATGFPDPIVAVEAVNTGGAIVMDINAQIFVFRGLGLFEQEPLATAACLAGTPPATTRWTGTVFFEDPKPPV